MQNNVDHLQRIAPWHETTPPPALSQPSSCSGDEGLAALISFLSSFDRPLSQPELLEILAEGHLSEDSVREWVAFDDRTYRRNPILCMPHVELLVLCWKPGQVTPIHDHAGSTGAVRVLRGTATEIQYDRSKGSWLVPAQSRSYSPGELISSHDTHVHQVGNFAEPDEPLITLHCYSKPLEGIRLFGRGSTWLADYDSVYERATLNRQIAGGSSHESIG